MTNFALPNINVTALGGESGRLSDLAGGGRVSVASGRLDVAQSIINGARQQVLSAQARAGALVGTTIESVQSLFDSTEVALTGAISRILDTDFAAETSRLVRSSILTDAAIGAVRSNSDRQRLVGSIFDLLARSDPRPGGAPSRIVTERSKVISARQRSFARFCHICHAICTFLL